MSAALSDAHRDRGGQPLAALRSAAERRLRALAPAEHDGSDLNQAVRYALLAPGKRIRPLLALLAYRELGRQDLAILDAACALEMVHAASLVLDDLPAMDNALSRRGRPATHVAFGQDVAILASISLLGLAFSTVAASRDLPAESRARAVDVIGRAIGSHGLAAGQYADLRPASVGARPLDHLADVNDRKTGVLFVAAVEIAAAAADVADERVLRLRAFAAHVGQAFQLLDDLLDGAESGSGEDRDRLTLVGLLGQADVRARINGHLRRALDNVAPGGDLAAFVQALFEAQYAGVAPMVAAVPTPR